MKRDPLDATDAERGQAVLVLQAPKLPLHGSAARPRAASGGGGVTPVPHAFVRWAWGATRALAHDGIVGRLPRNVITLVPRSLVRPLPRNGGTRRRVEAAVVERYRARVEEDPERIEINFPTRRRAGAAKDEVAELLARVDPRWPRVFKLYPTERALGETGE